MTGAQVKALQRSLNKFTNRFLKYVTPLRVDGDYGAATKKRIKAVKYYLGYPKAERNAKADAELRWRLRHPKRYNRRYAPLRRLTTAARRRVRQRKAAEKDHAQLAQHHGKGFSVFDGKTVAAWMVPWLQRSRREGWRGTVVSGVRTPEYSEHLCFQMCGRPSCPGRCAGRSSNHNMLPSQGEPFGALDVSDYANFGRIQRQIGSPLRNALGARDPVHFSVSGR